MCVCVPGEQCSGLMPVNNNSAAEEGAGCGWGVAVEVRQRRAGRRRDADRWEHREEGRRAAGAINSAGGGGRRQHGRGKNIVSIQLT